MTEPRKGIDFHLHSNHSDGTFPVKEVVRFADEAKLVACALTDHDTVSGIDEFLTEGKKYPNLKLYSGVELSSLFGTRELHIVGLGFDHNSPELLEFLANMRIERRQRAELMAQKLASCGYPVPDIWQEREVIGRMHFAEMLKDNYPFETLNDVFATLLRPGKPGFVPRTLPMPTDAIKIIHQAGGVAIWAHPLYEQAKERAFGRKVLKRLIPAGLDGMEGYYSGFSEIQEIMIHGLANDNNLLLSGGSDFHGNGHSGVKVAVGHGNLYVPESLLEGIDAKIEFHQKHRGEII